VSKPADYVRSIREALGISQEELARRVMVSRNYVSLIESGHKTPSPRLMSAIKALIIPHQAPAAHKVTVTTLLDAVCEEVGYDVTAPASRATCEAYFRARCDEAEASGDPNVFPYILKTLERALPPGEFARVQARVASLVGPGPSPNKLVRASVSVPREAMRQAFLASGWKTSGALSEAERAEFGRMLDKLEAARDAGTAEQREAAAAQMPPLRERVEAEERAQSDTTPTPRRKVGH
jgi:transcriptional regulator with XRE-family HTH domain